MPDSYIKLEPIGSLIGTRAIETSSEWAKREGGRKKARQLKKKPSAGKGHIDIRV